MQRAWLWLGAGLHGGPGGRGARGAVAPHGDVRSSWSRGLPPAADVKTMNNRERSVEGGIPRCSQRSPSFRPSPSPGRPGSLRPWGRREGERERLLREAAARARVERAAAFFRAPRSEERLSETRRVPSWGLADGEITCSLVHSPAQAEHRLGWRWSVPAPSSSRSTIECKYESVSDLIYMREVGDETLSLGLSPDSQRIKNGYGM